ncbi:MAG: protein kinase [Planctomycetes bacterium]|nr:protein kinase [Planctomycetota bacterium]
MPERQKSIVAAILAVHSGRISPDEAAAMLEDPGKTSSLVDFDGDVPTVSLSGIEGQYELPIIDVLENPEFQKRALNDIGIDEKAQQTLFNFGGNGNPTDMRVLRDTLHAVATTGRELAGTDVRPRKETAAASESPTQAPAKNSTLRITTSRFADNFGIQSERYDIKKEHARGGMGRVLLARDKAVGREVALKELLPGMVGSATLAASVPAGVSESGGIVERFLREAKITGQLEHPNIVPVYEIGQYPDGNFYYTMRFIRGKTLAERLREIRKDETLGKEEKLPARIKLLDQFTDVCNAIAYAHSKGVIHRDIKPENIMLGDYGETLVLDWGLARLKGQEDKAMKALQKGSLALSKSLLDSDSQALTLDGSIVGTPAYMAPEQARGELEHVDEKSDVYALGAVLYQILTGHPPFEGPMAALIVQQVLAGPPARVRTREPQVPPELEALVERAMAREKAERLGSALELASEVKAFRDGRTLGSYSYSTREMIARFVKQNRTAVSIAVLGVLLLIAGAIFALQRLTDERDAAMTAQKDAESGKALAQGALDIANRERKERERLEAEKLRKDQEDFKLRVREAEQVLGTIEGMRIEPALLDLEQRLSRYDAELKGPPARRMLELSPDEQIGNSVLLSNILGYVSARQNLLDLLDGPAGAELPGVFERFDLTLEREQLNQLRQRTARLACVNGDFTLAEFLVAGSSMPAELIRREKADIASAREALLNLHATRIDEALFDVRSGIGRAGRDPAAPTLDEYTRRLSQYREFQTVQILGKELDRLAARQRAEWSRSDVHLSVLACRVLGKVEQPAATVPMLAKFLERVTTPEAIEAAGIALGDTGSGEAMDVLLANVRRRGIDYWRSIQGALARLPLPARLRGPQSADEWLDLAIVRGSRGDFVGSADAATRMLNLSEGNTTALLVRGMSRAEAGLLADAMTDFDKALKADPDHYEIRLARALARNAYLDGDAAIADLTAAIALRPDEPRAYLHRARILALRARVADAREDFAKAVSLDPLHIGYRLEYGEHLQTLGRAAFADAEAEFTKVIEAAPDDWRGWSARCVLRRDTGFGGCISDGLEATRLNPKAAAAWNFMSQAYFGMGLLTDGIEAATNSVNADPTQWLAYYYRGILWLKMQEREDGAARGTGLDARFEESRNVTLGRAVNDFRSVVAHNPQDFRSWALMGVTLVDLERYEEARIACINALNLAPFGGFQATIGMSNHLVRQALLEIEGAALVNRNPGTTPELVRVAQYHIQRASRHRSKVAEYRLAMARLKEARDRIAPDSPATERYELASAEYRLVGALIAAEYYADALRLADARIASGEYVFPVAWVSRARALAGWSAHELDARFEEVGMDDAERAKAKAAFDAMTPMQHRERADEFITQCFAALHTAVSNGLKDATTVNGDATLAPLRNDERWAVLQAAMKISTATPPADPGDPTPIVVLVYVNEQGPAWHAGLRSHDVVVEANGVAVTTQQDFFNQLRSVQPGAEYMVRVRRYLLKDARLVAQVGEDGKPVLGPEGLPVWKYTEHEIKLKGGFLGLRLETCELPSPLYP